MLYGRQAELGEIEALLERTRGGDGGALLLVGEPGIGKTALVEAARERAGEMAVIDARAVEGQARLPFATLSELARPLVDRVDELPPPQREALSGALALTDATGAAPDRLAAYLGFLALLRLGARERGLLVLVDDAHWADDASSGCLAYVARRFAGSGIALIAAARSGERETPLTAAPIATVTLGGLDRADAEELLRHAGEDLEPRAVEALVDATLGNPLALIVLPRALSAEQRRGQVALGPLPAPGGAIGAAFGNRLDRLDGEARSAVVVAAAALDRSATSIAAACRDLGLGDAALERAEEAAILEITPERIAFTHPLLRSAAYGSAGPDERRAAHRALAEHCDEDRRAWHLAAAAEGPQPEVAAALEAAAFRATGRGAHLAAADALERAAELSDRPAREPRLFSAGLAAAIGGSFARAAELLERAARTDDGGLRATARHLLAMVRLTGRVGDTLDNHRLLWEEGEARTDEDPAGAASLFADAGVAAVIAAEAELALKAAERAIAVCPESASATVRCQAHSIHGMALMINGRAREAGAAFDRAGALLGEIELLGSAPQSIALALRGRVSTGQVGRLREEMRQLVAAAQEQRSLGILPFLRQVGADAAYRLGDWDAAEEESERAAMEAEASNQPGPLASALAVQLRVLAARGKIDEAREVGRQALDLGTRPGSEATGAIGYWIHAALGFLELGLGRPDEAVPALERARGLADAGKVADPLIIPWAPDLVEAYAAVGRDEDARAVAATLAAQAERNATPLALALAARASAIATGDEAGFARALELHDDDEQPFERARTLLAAGRHLHRVGSRADARERLREALAILEPLEAEPWVKQVREELRAAGAIERATVDDSELLTPQELRVARAVAAGATNKQVAAELFVSPKTIEYHLGRVYRKLGIKSRAELATLIAAGDLEEDAAPPAPAGSRDRSEAPSP